MKLGKFSTALLCGASVFAFSTLANSADIDVPASDWTGLHIGIGAGYGMIDHDISATLDEDVFGSQVDLGLDGIGGEGALATIEAGYDFRLNEHILLGLQADYTRSNVATTLDVASGALTYDLEATDTINLLARGGRLVDDSTLMYVIGGWTKTWFNGNLYFGDTVAYDFEKSGWTIGGGVETAISNNLTAKLEYRATRYNTIEIFNEPGFLSVNSDTVEQTARAVISYHGGNVHAYQGGFENADWTGVHVGLGGGFGLVNHQLTLDPNIIPATFSGVGGKGFSGAIEAGIDYQAGERFVVGLQGDYTRSNIGTNITVDISGLGSGFYTLEATDTFNVLARAGVLSSPNVLWFGEAGWTRTTFNGDLNIGGPFATYNYDANGLTIGAGVEAKLSNNVSWKTEYRYTSYESKDIIPDILSADTNLQSVRSTISYRF